MVKDLMTGFVIPGLLIALVFFASVKGCAKEPNPGVVEEEYPTTKSYVDLD